MLTPPCVSSAGDDRLPALQVLQPGAGLVDGEQPALDERRERTGDGELATAEQRDDLADAAVAVDEGEQSPLLAGAARVERRRRREPQDGVGRRDQAGEVRPDLHPAVAFGDQFLGGQAEVSPSGSASPTMKLNVPAFQRSSSQTASVAWSAASWVTSSWDRSERSSSARSRLGSSAAHVLGGSWKARRR